MLKEYKLIGSRIIGESSIAQSLCIRCHIGVALRDKAGLHGRNGDAVDSRHVILNGGLGIVDKDAETHFRNEMVERHDDGYYQFYICSKEQVYLYFRKFDPEIIEIVAPESLRNRMLQFYMSGVKAYQPLDTDD